MVAEMALTLGMDVVGYDPALSVEAAWRLSSKVRKADTLSTLFARSDYITLHLPGNAVGCWAVARFNARKFRHVRGLNPVG